MLANDYGGKIVLISAVRYKAKKVIFRLKFFFKLKPLAIKV